MKRGIILRYKEKVAVITAFLSEHSLEVGTLSFDEQKNEQYSKVKYTPF